MSLCNENVYGLLESKDLFLKIIWEMKIEICKLSGSP